MDLKFLCVNCIHNNICPNNYNTIVCSKYLSRTKLIQTPLFLGQTVFKIIPINIDCPGLKNFILKKGDIERIYMDHKTMKFDTFYCNEITGEITANNDFFTFSIDEIGTIVFDNKNDAENQLEILKMEIRRKG